MPEAIVVSPDGNRIVIEEGDAPEYLANGYITDEVYQEQQKEAAAQKYQEWLNDPESEAERFEKLRKLRDMRISATDYLLSADYPISAEKLEQVKNYRQALRDLPGQDGAPWDGGGSLTPWPLLEEV